VRRLDAALDLGARRSLERQALSATANESDDLQPNGAKRAKNRDRSDFF
jgi:hypothetical protein